jgi:hypothetical protein
MLDFPDPLGPTSTFRRSSSTVTSPRTPKFLIVSECSPFATGTENHAAMAPGNHPWALIDGYLLALAIMLAAAAWP